MPKEYLLKAWAGIEGVDWNNLNQLEKIACKEHYDAHRKWTYGSALKTEFSGESWYDIRRRHWFLNELS